MDQEPKRLAWARLFLAGDGTYGTIQSTRDQGDPGLIHVEVHDQFSPFVAAADVRAGRVVRIEYLAKDGQRITHRLIRSSNLVSFFERWAAISEAVFRAEDEGDHYTGLQLMVNGSEEGQSPEDLLAILESRIAEHRATTQRKRARGHAADELLLRVVQEYKEAVAGGDPKPRTTIARRLGYSPEHIGRLLVKARRTDPPLLGPARRGRAGEETL